MGKKERNGRRVLSWWCKLCMKWRFVFVTKKTNPFSYYIHNDWFPCSSWLEKSLENCVDLMRGLIDCCLIEVHWWLTDLSIFDSGQLIKHIQMPINVWIHISDQFSPQPWTQIHRNRFNCNAIWFDLFRIDHKIIFCRRKHFPMKRKTKIHHFKSIVTPLSMSCPKERSFT